MALNAQHELHKRRFSRNVGLGLVLVGFVGIVFGVTIVKISNGSMMEAYDHAARPSLTIPEGN